jgi:hypothetical protein
MRNPAESPLPRTKFILLQVAAFAVAFGTPVFVPLPLYLLEEALLFFAGLAMGIVGLLRCGRSGQSAGHLLKSSLAVFVAALFCWPVLASLVLFLLRSFPKFDQFRSWEPILSGPLPFLSAGSLAYFGLGPFRSNVSPGQVLRQLIVGNRDLRIGGPAQFELVAKAERLLGLTLPTPFRDFLLDYGEIRGTSLALLGLGPATDLDRPSTDDFVGATLDARARLGLPRGYALCKVDADGLMACLDTTAIETEIPVVLWNPATRSVVRVAAPSFPQYLIDTLRPKPRPR